MSFIHSFHFELDENNQENATIIHETKQKTAKAVFKMMRRHPINGCMPPRISIIVVIPRMTIFGTTQNR